MESKYRRAKDSVMARPRKKTTAVHQIDLDANDTVCRAKLVMVSAPVDVVAGVWSVVILMEKQAPMRSANHSTTNQHDEMQRKQRR